MHTEIYEYIHMYIYLLLELLLFGIQPLPKLPRCGSILYINYSA